MIIEIIKEKEKTGTPIHWVFSWVIRHKTQTNTIFFFFLKKKIVKLHMHLVGLKPMTSPSTVHLALARGEGAVWTRTHWVQTNVIHSRKKFLF